MNNATFAGRAAGPAELRKTQSGQSSSNFSLAVDRPKRNGEKQDPLWIRVTLWGKLAETVSQFITKGKQLTVSGSVDLRSFETQGGEKRTDLTLNADKLTLLGGGEKKQNSEAESIFS